MCTQQATATKQVQMHNCRIAPSSNAFGTSVKVMGRQRKLALQVRVPCPSSLPNGNNMASSMPLAHFALQPKTSLVTAWALKFALFRCKDLRTLLPEIKMATLVVAPLVDAECHDRCLVFPDVLCGQGVCRVCGPLTSSTPDTLPAHCLIAVCA